MKRLVGRIINYLSNLNKWVTIALYTIITAVLISILHIYGVTYDKMFKASIIFSGVISIYFTSINMYDTFKLRELHKNNDRLREVCDYRLNVSSFIIIAIFYIMNDVFK
jgi:hypothetical protein